MSHLAASIPLCDQPTPKEILDAIPKKLMARLIGLYMNNENNDLCKANLTQMQICLDALLLIPNIMRWNVAPLIRQAMADTRSLSSSIDWGDVDEKKKQMDKSIEALLSFCNQKNGEQDDGH